MNIRPILQASIAIQLRSIPRLAQIAEQVVGHWIRYDDVTLVGHSQSRLIIQLGIAQLPSANRGEQLKKIRHVIPLGTP